MNLPELISEFSDEEACHEYLAELRWPEGVACPRCGGMTISRIKKRRQYDCDDCRYQFSVRVGSVLQDSKLPLWKWFIATYLMIESRKGISSNQVKRMVGVSYKTAWYLTHRIRAALKLAVEGRISGPVVELDETHVGGKVRGRGRGYRGNKTMVVAAVQRGGEIRLRVEKRADFETVHSFISDYLDDSIERIHTDESSIYLNLDLPDRPHESVNHGDDEWVRGDVTTNSVESVFSLLKRAIVGSYHQLSAKHLDAYLDEIEWKFNNRDNEFLFRDTLLAIVNSENLEYKDLTA